MKVLAKVLTIFLLIMFVALLVLLVKTYRDVNESKRYVEFVTNSANEILTEVEGVNGTLNALNYNGDEQDVSDLEVDIEGLKSTYERITSEKESYSAVDSSALDNKFEEFLNSTSEVISSGEKVVESIKNLEEKEEFDAKLDEYITKSGELDTKSVELQNELNVYVDNYSKFDFERLLNGF